MQDLQHVALRSWLWATAMHGLGALSGFFLALVAWVGVAVGSGVEILLLMLAAYPLIHFRRWGGLVLFVLLCPPVSSSLLATHNYFQGTARVQRIGWVGSRAYLNPDRETRCRTSSGGCSASGGEYIYVAPYNGGLRLLTRSLGPMAGTYTGPYPTREEAQNLLADGGQEFQARDLLRDRVTIDDAQIALDEGVGKGILSMLDERHADSSYRLFHAGLIERLATAAIVQQRCLVLRIPVRSRNANAAGDSALLVLIDLQCGRPFAYYSEKEFIWQGGPVPWKRPELR